MQSNINISMVALSAVSRNDLQWIATLDNIGYDKRSARELIEGIAEGRFALWRLSGDASGVFITSLTPRALWIEGMAGEGILRHAAAIRDKLQDIKAKASKAVIQGTVDRPGLQRLYERLGHKPVATIMEA